MYQLVTSRARVRTENPARRAKVLSAYFREPIETEWDPDQKRGHIVFRRAEDGAPESMCDLLCGEGVLMLALEAPARDIGHLEQWVEDALASAAGDEAGSAGVGWTRRTALAEG
ncbi:DUF2218 domain-containing protein [Corynebacterium sp. UBA2622]|uniref:DUF2218 domain-containing protein n=1 Tax=Corynebacterium sp. UBA2622 TaxID=1946393 RepID=UPI0025C1FBA7|nr:DUF2218 domain-containing protein [Corynebacterium sp. UBA2622]